MLLSYCTQEGYFVLVLYDFDRVEVFSENVIL